MLETILAILSAIVTIFIASVLVKKQNNNHEMSEELTNEVSNNFETALDHFVVLTGNDPNEHTIAYLEEKVEELSVRISPIHINYKQEPHTRRSKHVKHKKNFAND